MKKIIIVVICVLNFIPLVASAQGKTKEERKNNRKEMLNYSIEYIPPILETDTAYTLLVRFYTKVTAQQAATVVRSELARILKNSPPSKRLPAF